MKTFVIVGFLLTLAVLVILLPLHVQPPQAQAARNSATTTMPRVNPAGISGEETGGNSQEGTWIGTFHWGTEGANGHLMIPAIIFPYVVIGGQNYRLIMNQASNEMMGRSGGFSDGQMVRVSGFLTTSPSSDSKFFNPTLAGSIVVISIESA